MSTRSPEHQPDPRPVAPGVAIAAVLAGVAVVVGVVAPPSAVLPGGMPPAGVAAGIGALVRIILATITSAVCVVGPGWVLRRRWPRLAAVPLGFLPLPGLAVLSVVGGLVWALAPGVDPQLVATVTLLPVIAAVLVAALRPDSSPSTERRRGEGRVLALAGAVLAVAMGKSLWSAGPTGELYGGTISRTLEVGDRSDSRISYHVVSLVTHGLDPATSPGADLFAPWAFGDRGPLPGLIAAPLVVLTGADPTAVMPDQVWSPFDAQGFVAYRIAMMVLALTVLPAVWSLTRAVGGAAAARIAVVVTAGTPFVVHEVSFTWPKLAAAAQVLLAALLVVRGRPGWAGLFVGLGYLMHPLALLSVPTLVLLIVLVRWHPGVTTRPGRWRGMAVGVGLLAVGVGAVALAWQLVNGGAGQGKFMDYLVLTNGQPSETVWSWVLGRANSLGNTLVPFKLPLTEAANPAINEFGGSSSAVVHFFFQYWNSLPFGVALLFLPFLVVGIIRLGLRHPWVVTATAVVPLLVFTVYWGSFNSGLLREGLHVWVITLLILFAVAARRVLQAGGWTATVVRVVLVVRLLEVLLMLAVPSFVGAPATFPVTDVAAWVLMLGGLGALGLLTWQDTAARPPLREDPVVGDFLIGADEPDDLARWASGSPRDFHRKPNGPTTLTG